VMSLPDVSGMDTVKALSKSGFRVIRQRGSHVRLEKRVGDEVIRLTVPLHRSLKKGTLRRIISDAGLTVQEFNRLL
jgi:predicted RNA binding protein YcfA (HicA-like mRNA interferase family)